ncbi:MAG: hypothetical protein RL654_1949 [Pseudomonadota bacterium]|jgi:hypothetical protein
MIQPAEEATPRRSIAPTAFDAPRRPAFSLRVLALAAGLAGGSSAAIAAELPTQQQRFMQALELAQRHQDGEAMRLFEQLVREQPGRPEPLVNLGVLLARHGRVDEARVAFEQALRTSAPHALAHDNLTRLQAQATADALAWAEPGTPAPPARASSWPARALLLGLLLGGGAAAALWMRHRRPAAAPRPSRLDPEPHAPGTTLTPRESFISLTDTPLPAPPAFEATVPAPPPATRPPARLAGAPAHRLPGAEEQLLAVYRLIGQSQLEEARRQVETLLRQTPRYPLARLACADLQLVLTGGLQPMPAGLDVQRLARWRQASALRLQSWQTAPPPEHLPRQVVHLADSVRQMVAIECATSRLFVLEQRAGQLRVATTCPVLVGPRTDERDLLRRGTPLGLYQIASRLSPRQIGEEHGAGALVLDHPNEHDRRLGRPAQPFWLHGPSPRPPGLLPPPSGHLVLTDEDLQRLMFELVPQRTPVLVAERLEWVTPRSLAQVRLRTRNLIEVWRLARARGDPEALRALYAADFDAGTGPRDPDPRLAGKWAASGGRDRQLADLSLFVWQDREEVLLASFREVLRGHAPGPLRRQYWAREHGQWKIFSETVSKD